MATTQELARRLGLTVDIKLVGVQANIPGDLLTTPDHQWSLLTVHETANTAVGANADMHREFVASGGGLEGVSFTYCVDSAEAIQILPENWAQYAQGTARGNYTSVSIETCVNSDGDWADTQDNLCKLIASIIAARGKTSVKGLVVQHNSWTGKQCPALIRSTPGAWEAILARAQYYLVQLAGVQAAPESIELNGFTISGGFYELWEQYGLAVLGLPLSGEYQQVEPELGNVTATYQDFENCTLQWYPGIQPRICAAVRRLKYGQ